MSQLNMSRLKACAQHNFLLSHAQLLYCKYFADKCTYINANIFTNKRIQSSVTVIACVCISHVSRWLTRKNNIKCKNKASCVASQVKGSLL